MPSENHETGEVACKTASSYLVRFSQPAGVSPDGWLFRFPRYRLTGVPVGNPSKETVRLLVRYKCSEWY